MLLVLSLSGVVAAATVLTAITAPVVDPTVPVVADTTNTFEDVNGDGIDDDCQTDVVADPVAAASAEAAADLNGDGQLSVSEAAQSGRTGGKNCNHGGYVSNVDRADSCDGSEPADTTDATETGADADANEQGDEADSGDADSDEAKTGDEAAVETTTTDPTTCTEPETSDTTPVVCPPAPVTTTPDATTTEATVPTLDLGPNAHGKAVAKVAHDKAAVGGKNCNHGGAVSEAAHDKAAKDAAKAARDAARALKHANKQHGKHHNG